MARKARGQHIQRQTTFMPDSGDNNLAVLLCCDLLFQAFAQNIKLNRGDATLPRAGFDTQFLVSQALRTGRCSGCWTAFRRAGLGVYFALAVRFLDTRQSVSRSAWVAGLFGAAVVIIFRVRCLLNLDVVATSVFAAVAPPQPDWLARPGLQSGSARDHRFGVLCGHRNVVCVFRHGQIPFTSKAARKVGARVLASKADMIVSCACPLLMRISTACGCPFRLWAHSAKPTGGTSNPRKFEPKSPSVT